MTDSNVTGESGLLPQGRGSLSGYAASRGTIAVKKTDGKRPSRRAETVEYSRWGQVAAEMPDLTVSETAKRVSLFELNSQQTSKKG